MLEAYCWPLSTGPGVPVGLHVSTDAGVVDVEVARLPGDRAFFGTGARPSLVEEGGLTSPGP